MRQPMFRRRNPLPTPDPSKIPPEVIKTLKDNPGSKLHIKIAPDGSVAWHIEGIKGMACAIVDAWLTSEIGSDDSKSSLTKEAFEQPAKKPVPKIRPKLPEYNQGISMPETKIRPTKERPEAEGESEKVTDMRYNPTTTLVMNIAVDEQGQLVTATRANDDPATDVVVYRQELFEDLMGLLETRGWEVLHLPHGSVTQFFLDAQPVEVEVLAVASK